MIKRMKKIIILNVLALSAIYVPTTHACHVNKQRALTVVDKFILPLMHHRLAELAPLIQLNERTLTTKENIGDDLDQRSTAEILADLDKEQAALLPQEPETEDVAATPGVIQEPETIHCQASTTSGHAVGTTAPSKKRKRAHTTDLTSRPTKKRTDTLQCRVCNQCVERSKFLDHSASHKGEKKFKCPHPECKDKEYSQRVHLNYHLKKHHHEIPSGCEPLRESTQLEKIVHAPTKPSNDKGHVSYKNIAAVTALHRHKIAQQTEGENALNGERS